MNLSPMNDNSTILLAIGLAGLSIWLYSLLAKKPSPAPFPPGPKGLPLLGNIADLPQSQPGVTFTKWGETYGASMQTISSILPMTPLLFLHSPLANCFCIGSIVHVSALGQSIIILNDVQQAFNMLDKRSSLYSDRPTLTMAGRLVGWDNSTVLLPFGDTWKEHRRMFAQFMGTPSKVDAFADVLQGEAHSYLHRILTDPAEWVVHGRRCVFCPQFLRS
jgi:hypothetical protein